MEKRFLGRPLCLLCLAAAQEITHAAHSLAVPVRWVACKGGLCFNPSSRVALLAVAPSLHVNRPFTCPRNVHTGPAGNIQNHLCHACGNCRIFPERYFWKAGIVVDSWKSICYFLFLLSLRSLGKSKSLYKSAGLKKRKRWENLSESSSYCRKLYSRKSVYLISFRKGEHFNMGICSEIGTIYSECRNWTAISQHPL